MSDMMDKEIRLTTDGSGGLIERQMSQPSAFDRWLLASMGRLVGEPRVRFLLWNGEVAYEPDSPAAGSLRFDSRTTLLKLCASPENVFAEGYVDGRIVLEGNPVDLLAELSLANRSAMPRGSLRRRVIELLRPPAGTSQRKAKQNIHSHYDLGNGFYSQWLDPQMVYTCAYYPNAEASLEQAQIAKMDHVCRKLELKPGQSVIETGCGWGSLARHMARHYGANVTAYNISHEQIVYAETRTRAEGLDDRVTFVEDDYRNATGDYDAFVSIGMLEHVGLSNFPALGATIDRTMKDHGRGLVHSIGRSWSEPVNAWIERNIFPGGAIPSLREMMDVFEPAGMSVLDVENLRLHYARTCREWLDRFESIADSVADEFGQDFVRAWRLYLAGSSAAFLIGNLQLFQVVIARAVDNTVPLTRDYMYPGAQADDEALSRLG